MFLSHHLPSSYNTQFFHFFIVDGSGAKQPCRCVKLRYLPQQLPSNDGSKHASRLVQHVQSEGALYATLISPES